MQKCWWEKWTPIQKCLASITNNSEIEIVYFTNLSTKHSHAHIHFKHQYHCISLLFIKTQPSSLSVVNGVSCFFLFQFFCITIYYVIQISLLSCVLAHYSISESNVFSILMDCSLHSFALSFTRAFKHIQCSHKKWLKCNIKF